MKKVFFIGAILLSGMMIIGNSVYAQSKSDLKKIRNERKEINKMTRDELNAKVSSAAKDEAKRLTKEGWKAAPGALPIERQLDRSYNMQYEFDENLMPKYLIGQAMSVGTAYDAAKMQAMTLAKENLAGQIATEVSALVEDKVENKQLSDDEAVSIVTAVSSGKQLISQSIGRVMPIIEIYRDKDNKNKEVSISVAYRTDMILKAAKDLIRKELEKKGSNAEEIVESLFK